MTFQELAKLGFEILAKRPLISIEEAKGQSLRVIGDFKTRRII